MVGFGRKSTGIVEAKWGVTDEKVAQELEGGEQKGP